MPGRIYLDHAATTPLDPRVLEAMLPCLTEAWGNPSSIYAEAREARRHLDAARRLVADLLGARPGEIVFTSGGSESDSLALRGIAAAAPGHARQVITVTTEHHAVLHTAAALEREGYRVTYLPVDGEGFVDSGALEAAVGPETVLVSVMLANNETGTIQAVPELARLVKARNPHVLVHTDAVQAAGMLDLDVSKLGVDALSLAAHKFYGPKGVGALYVRSGTAVEAQILGGSQEKERRAGTENVAGAVGLAAALRLATEELLERVRHVRALRDRLLTELPGRVAGTRITGPLDDARRLADNFSGCFEGIEAEMLLMQLDLAGVSASSGSACTSGSLEPSHVLTAMGIPEDLARGSLRLTVGNENTTDEIGRVLDCLPGFVERLRGHDRDIVNLRAIARG
jgi:cysteine desulfurase